MKQLMATILLLAGTPAFCESASDIVLKYECANDIKSADIGFTCGVENGQVRLSVITPMASMPPEQTRHAQYQYAKLGLRILSLGYKGFSITYPDGREKWCYQTPANRQPLYEQGHLSFVCLPMR